MKQVQGGAAGSSKFCKFLQVQQVLPKAAATTATTTATSTIPSTTGQQGGAKDPEELGRAAFEDQGDRGIERPLWSILKTLVNNTIEHLMLHDPFRSSWHPLMITPWQESQPGLCLEV